MAWKFLDDLLEGPAAQDPGVGPFVPEIAGGTFEEHPVLKLPGEGRFGLVALGGQHLSCRRIWRTRERIEARVTATVARTRHTRPRLRAHQVCHHGGVMTTRTLAVTSARCGRRGNSGPEDIFAVGNVGIDRLAVFAGDVPVQLVSLEHVAEVAAVGKAIVEIREAESEEERVSSKSAGGSRRLRRPRARGCRPFSGRRPRRSNRSLSGWGSASGAGGQLGGIDEVESIFPADAERPRRPSAIAPGLNPRAGGRPPRRRDGTRCASRR